MELIRLSGNKFFLIQYFICIFMISVFSIFTNIIPSDDLTTIIFTLIIFFSAIIGIYSNINVSLFLVALAVGKIYLFFILDPIYGSDELGYYTNALSFYNSESPLDLLVSEFLATVVRDVFSFVEPLIGFFYFCIFLILGDTNPKIVFILNFLFILLSTGILLRSSKQCEYKYKTIVIWVAFSPYLSYWGANFFKDFISLLFISLTLYFLTKKRYLLFFAFLILSTAIRSYSLVVICVYYLFFFGKLRLTALCALISFIVSLFVYPGVLSKFLKILVYFFISPNPLNSENYDFIMGTQIIEAVFIFLVIFIGFLQYDTRRYVLNLVFCISIYASCIYMVDNRLTYSWGLSQDTITENYHRKKMPIFPIFIFSTVYILSAKSRRTKISSN
jgi:hypothetical protein